MAKLMFYAGENQINVMRAPSKVLVIVQSRKIVLGLSQLYLSLSTSIKSKILLLLFSIIFSANCYEFINMVRISILQTWKGSRNNYVIRRVIGL